MFIVAPIGIMNWAIELRMPSLSSATFIEYGIVAAELDVENAKSCAFFIFDKYFLGFIPVVKALVKSFIKE